MKRAAALLVALVLAGIAAWAFSRSADPTGAAACAEVERRLQAGDSEGALDAVVSARKRVPPYVARYLDAILDLYGGRDEAALAAAEEALAMAPEARDDWRVVSTVFFARLNTGRGDDAIALLDRYLTAHPGDERAHAAAAQYWLEGRPEDPDPEKAVSHLDRIAALSARVAPPGDPTAVQDAVLARLRARARELRDMWGSAVVAAEERVRAAPADPEARIQLGEAYRHIRRIVDARRAFREALRLRPGTPLWLRQYLLLLLEPPTDPATVDEAVLVSGRLLETDPQAPDVQFLRARVLVHADRIDEAIALYRGLLARDLPREARRDVCRNLAVALYDWKQGGKPGDYMDEAHTLLTEYVRLGGEIDLRLGDVWEKLEARAKAKGAAPR